MVIVKIWGGDSKILGKPTGGKTASTCAFAFNRTL